MTLREVILHNFRAYKTETRLDVDDLTVLVGKNDMGKSCVLEALEIFFNSDSVSFELADLSRGGTSDIVIIGCSFDDLPDDLVLDANARTSLEQEFLLAEGGRLELIKIYDCTSGRVKKESVFAVAQHPTAGSVNDLLQLKNADLKTRLTDQGIDVDSIDLRSNPEIRRALWAHADDLAIQSVKIPLDKEDGKRIWEWLQKHLPLYALFQADRPSRDEDSEVQDPMKLAVKEALSTVADQLEAIKEAVRATTLDVANRTLAKLAEIDPSLAMNLTPVFRAEPKWDSLFKMGLEGDDQIPMNKRGSGVRRLILLNFFRAEAERRLQGAESTGLIYAIEEPETSQHPSYQRLLITALTTLASTGAQVLITTHNPAIAGLVPVENVRHVRKTAAGVQIEANSDVVWTSVANELGVLPDSRVRVLVGVEGSNDIACLGHFSKTLHAVDAAVPSLSDDSALAMIPLGGSSLKEWVNKHYLKPLNKREAHLYDRDTATPPQYQGAVDVVNARGDGSFAQLTSKRELENYLHPDAITAVLGVTVTFGNMDDVPALVAEALYTANPDAAGPWTALAEDRRKEKIKRAKRRLSDDVAATMTADQIRACDTGGELETWLKRIPTIA